MFGEGKTTEESKLGNETISCSLPVLVVRMDMDRNWTKLVQLFQDLMLCLQKPQK